MIPNVKDDIMSLIMEEGENVSIRKKELQQMFDRLEDRDKKTVYDFMRFLLEHPNPYHEIDKREPDDIPLSAEEKEQMSGKRNFVSLEDAKRELGL